MNRRLIFFLFALVFLSAFASTAAVAASVAIDPSNPNNGLLNIYSATFDGPLGPGDPFFGGSPPPNWPGDRAIVITPEPTGVLAAADTSLCKQAYDPSNPTAPITPPCTTLYSTAMPSALDLVLSSGNTQMAINGGSVFFPNLTMVIEGGTANQTDVSIEGASMIDFAASSGAVPVDGNGVAVFEIDTTPAIAVDFSIFTEVVTGCTGPLCPLIPILTLDMIRYRLTIDWDPTFTSFDADFIGQGSGNSMVFATLDSAVVPLPGAAYLFVSALGLLGWMRRRAT